jgi:hypothetical protein
MAISRELLFFIAIGWPVFVLAVVLLGFIVRWIYRLFNVGGKGK